MFFKIIYNSENRKINSVLKWLHLDHPSLQRLKQLSEGSPETLIVRSKEYGKLLDDLWINGVNKKTGLRRLATLDEWLLSVIPKPFSASISIMDVGGSDGSTTFELVQYLNENLGIEIKASILEMQLRLHCFRRGFIRYYLTNDKIPFLLQIGPVGILLEEKKCSKMRFVFNPLVRFIKKYLKRLCLENYLRNEGDLLLKNPIAKENSNIYWIEQDLFQFNQALVGAFDFIRCCNILNYSYFSEVQISKAVQLLAHYLKPKGFLLVSRSLENSNSSLHRASLWVRTRRGLKHISDLNGGSEIKEIVQKILEDS